MNKISLLLVDDHPIVRAGYRQLLSNIAHIDVLAESDSAEKACQLYVDLKPDIVIMDLNLPGMSGLEAIRRITSADPTAVILAFTINDELLYLERALTTGAKGYLTKSGDPRLLLKGIEALAAGHSFIDPILLKKQALKEAKKKESLSRTAELSPREFDVYNLLIKGKTSKEIADTLYLSQKTVANYATQIKLKLGVKTIAEMSYLAQRDNDL